MTLTRGSGFRHLGVGLQERLKAAPHVGAMRERATGVRSGAMYGMTG
jgi:hypothetical protein